MNRHVVQLNRGHEDTEIFANDGDKRYHLLSVGKGTYITEMMLDAGSTRASIIIGRYTSIGPHSTVEIGNNHNHHMVSTYPFRDFDVSDEDTNHYYENNHYQIIIGNDVWIGEGVKILGGVHIGNGAVIGMGAVVTKDVPPYSVVVGNPARVVKYRFDKEVIRKLESIRWWWWDDAVIQAARDDMTDPEKFVDKYYKEIHIPETELTKTMDEVKSSGGRTFYFAMDQDSPRPLWDKVLAAFAEAFSHDDNMTLFLEVPETLESELSDEDLIRLNTILSQCKGIVPVPHNSPMATAVFCHVMIIIASSCVKALSHIDMAEFLGIEVRSACDWESGLFR